MTHWLSENLFYFFLLILLGGCSTAGIYEVSQEFHRPSLPSDSLQQAYTEQVYDELNIDSVNNTPDEYLKAHMDDGGLYVFRNSKIRANAEEITGKAYYFNAQRQQDPLRPYTIGKDSIAIIESNNLITSAPFQGLMVFTGASLALSGFCAARPKACFGSCPTFYSSGKNPQLKAEGFSSSFSPALERKDVDALTGLNPDGSSLQLTMKNEALETHVVRRADLLAVPAASDSGRIYRSRDGTFWSINQQFKPAECRSENGSCLDVITQHGRRGIHPNSF